MTEPINKPTLYVIDGSNCVYRAFYAIRQLSNSKGFPTNAIYGFVNMLNKLFRERKPDYIVVVFDAKGPTFRSEAYEQYKAHRPAMPDTLIPQFPYIKEIVRAFAIPLMEQTGIEADDIIGSVARQAEAKGLRTVIVSGDKDLMQLVTDDIVMLDTMKDKTYDIAGVKERFGVAPDQVADILGLMGDASDNIPGVPGVGEKTALNLVTEFGSVEGVLQNLQKVKSTKIRESLEKNADLARLSRELATLRTDLGIDFNLEDARFSEPDKERLRDLYRECEFSSLIRDLQIREEHPVGRYRVVTTQDDLKAVLKELAEKDIVALSLELDSDIAMTAEVVGLSLCAEPGKACYIPVGDGSGEIAPDRLWEKITPLMANAHILKHGHDLKRALIILARNGIHAAGLGCDTMVASYVLDPSRRGHDLTEIARDFLNVELPPLTNLTGTGAKKNRAEDVLAGSGHDVFLPTGGYGAGAVWGADGKDRRGGPWAALCRNRDAAGRGAGGDGEERGSGGPQAARGDVGAVRKAPRPFGREDLWPGRRAFQCQFSKTASAYFCSRNLDYPRARRRKAAIQRMWMS